MKKIYESVRELFEDNYYNPPITISWASNETIEVNEL